MTNMLDKFMFFSEHECTRYAKISMHIHHRNIPKNDVQKNKLIYVAAEVAEVVEKFVD